MLHIESPHQGIYTPLMAMTDSDSEEQLFLRHQQPNQNRRLGNRNPPDSLALRQNPSPLLQFKRQQHKLMHQQNEQRQQRSQRLDSNDASGAASDNNPQPSSYTTNMQNTFRSVMMSDGGGEPGSSFSSFNSDYDDLYAADNVAILSHHDDPKDTESHPPMSQARKCCFIASLVLCFLAVIGFIWFVPCTQEGICPAPLDRVRTHNWLSKYANIEFKGGIQVVTGLRSWEKNLIFLYRGDYYFPESTRPGNTKRNGVISLIGSSGAVAWFDEMHDEPLAIDCTLIDVDRNGQPDCLVMDEYGELGIINPISGQWYWKYKERSAQKIDANDFPLILPDLDGDGVLEILFVTSADLLQRTKMLALRRNGDSHHIPAAPRNYLRILSGRTGVPIGEGFEKHDCDLLRKLSLDADTQIVSFACVRNKTETRRSKTLAELFALITNKSLMNTMKWSPSTGADVSQHHRSTLHQENDAQRNIYSLSGRELVVENRGKCPEHCNVTFILSDGRNGKVEVLYNFTESNKYGMAPVQWHFKNSNPEMSGFVMKFWKWNKINNSQNSTKNADSSAHQESHGAESVVASTPKSTPSKNQETKASLYAKDNDVKPKKPAQNQGQNNQTNNNKTTFNSGQWNQVHNMQRNFVDYDKFDHLIKKRESYSLMETVTADNKPANMSSSKKALNKTGSHSPYQMEMVTETVILIVFNGPYTRIENTSQSSILQFCRNDSVEGIVCQPELNNQENSILIADLDDDDSQEQVSFTSTFVEETEDPTVDYKLVTYVRLLRLQEELPKLYGNGKKN